MLLSVLRPAVRTRHARRRALAWLLAGAIAVSAVPAPLAPLVAQTTTRTSTPSAGSSPTTTALVVTPRGTYVPHRVYDAKRGAFTDFETMTRALAAADIVFLGEQHDDAPTHVLEDAVLAGLDRRGVPVTLSLEMFERDVQAGLDGYLRGDISVTDFLGTARPWPNYPTDYAPLVERARAGGWPVVAANIPRRLAQVVSRAGLGALDTIPIAELAFIARERACPRDAYWERFRGAMGDMSGHGMSVTDADAMVWRFYGAQCMKDETMAEAIAGAHRADPARTIVHVNGAFHSDFTQGTAARVARRLGDRASLAVVSFVPVPDLDAPDVAATRGQGDWIVFTLRPATPPATAPSP